MKRSTEFDATVKHGTRIVQPDVIVHVRRGSDRDECGAARIGLIVAAPVGSAVERHRVARRLRHVARTIWGERDQCDRVVIRALASSRSVSSAELEQQLRRAFESAGPKT